jgi:hypothetical protein
MNKTETNRIDIFDETIYKIPHEQAETFFYISFLIVFTTIYTLYKRQYDLFVLSLLVLLTSLNHWHDPQIGIRRNIDIVLIWVGAFYVFIRAVFINRIKSVIFWVFYFTALSSFLVSWYLFANGYIWYSTLSHCLLHVCSNASIMLLC